MSKLAGRLLGLAAICFASLSLVFVACAGGPGGGDDDDDEQTPSGPPAELDDLPERYADTYCEPMYRCCNTREREAILGEFEEEEIETEEECRSQYKEWVRTGLRPELRESEDNGRIDYQPEPAGDCLPPGEKISCSNIPRDSITGACEDAVVPKVEVGDRCEHNWECKKGVCIYNLFDGEDEGLCKIRSEAGSSCGGTGCKPDLYCDGSNDICRSKKSIGEECDDPDECASDVCRENNEGDELCSAKFSGGSDCTRDSQCQSGYCHGNSAISEGDCLSEPVCDGN